MRNSGPDGGSKRRLDERGQTLQDYALGIGLFSLVVVGVLSGTFTTALAPFDDGVGAGKQAQADRIAKEIVSNETMSLRFKNDIHPARYTTLVAKNQTELRDRYDVPQTSHINISLHELNGSVVSNSYPVKWTTDHGPGNQPAATSTRLVAVRIPGTQDCVPGCRLVVRVW